MCLVEFLNKEIKEIETYKWLESEKMGHDLGLEAEIDWVLKYGKIFREQMEKIYGKIK